MVSKQTSVVGDLDSSDSCIRRLGNGESDSTNEPWVIAFGVIGLALLLVWQFAQKS